MRRSETARLATRHLARVRAPTTRCSPSSCAKASLRGADESTCAARLRRTGRDGRAVHRGGRDIGVDGGELLDLLDAVRQRPAPWPSTQAPASPWAPSMATSPWPAGAGPDDCHRRDEHAGRCRFHPVSEVFEDLDLPVLPEARSSVRGRDRPETQSFLGEWPCAVAPDEIEAGNMRAVPELRRRICSSRSRPEPARARCWSLELLVTTDMLTPTAAISMHVLPTKDQLEQADVSLCVLTQRCRCSTHRWSSRLASGARRGGCSPSWYDVSVTTLLRPTRPTTRCSPAVTGSRCSWDEARRHRRGRGATEAASAMVEHYLEKSGGWRLAPSVLVDQLASLEPPPARPAQQVKKLNAALDFLGGTRRCQSIRTTRSEAGVVDGAVIVRTDRGAHRRREVDASITPRCGVDSPRSPQRQRQRPDRQGRRGSPHRHGALPASPSHSTLSTRLAEFITRSAGGGQRRTRRGRRQPRSSRVFGHVVGARGRTR